MEKFSEDIKINNKLNEFLEAVTNINSDNNIKKIGKIQISVALNGTEGGTYDSDSEIEDFITTEEDRKNSFNNNLLNFLERFDILWDLNLKEKISDLVIQQYRKNSSDNVLNKADFEYLENEYYGNSTNYGYFYLDTKEIVKELMSQESFEKFSVLLDKEIENKKELAFYKKNNPEIFDLKLKEINFEKNRANEFEKILREERNIQNELKKITESYEKKLRLIEKEKIDFQKDGFKKLQSLQEKIKEKMSALNKKSRYTNTNL